MLGADGIVAQQQRHHADIGDMAIDRILLARPAQDVEIEFAQIGAGRAGVGKLLQIETMRPRWNVGDGGKSFSMIQDRLDLADEFRAPQ